jgi:hypothetical protein
VVKLKASKSDAGSNYDSKPEKGRWIIEVEPNATIATTKIQPGESHEPQLSFTNVGERNSTTIHH